MEMNEIDTRKAKKRELLIMVFSGYQSYLQLLPLMKR
jgi:hypothetical protein